MGCCFGDDKIELGDPYIPDDRSPKILHNKIKQDFESFKGLDIYQMTALASKNEEDSCVKCCYYFKSIVLFIMQTTILSAIIYQNYPHSNNITERENEQEIETDIITIICGFLFSSFISINFWKIFWNIDHKGLYKIWAKTFDDCPIYVNPYWIFIGLYINFINLFISLIAFNVIIIHNQSQNNILEMILNCIAIFFMLFIGEIMIDDDDYDKINKIWIPRIEQQNLQDQPSNAFIHSQCCLKYVGCLFQFLILFCILLALAAPFVVLSFAFI